MFKSYFFVCWEIALTIEWKSLLYDLINLYQTYTLCLEFVTIHIETVSDPEDEELHGKFLVRTLCNYIRSFVLLNQNISLSTGFTQVAQFFQSQRGRTILRDAEGHHRFKRDKVNLLTTNWRCYARNCTGRAVTKWVNGRELMKLTRSHNHSWSDVNKYQYKYN